MNADAKAWERALRRQWDPLGHEPASEAEAAALGLHWGLDDWHPGSRAKLLADATKGVRAAFVTLACRDWPGEANKESLPKELAWVHAGRQLNEQIALPVGGQIPADALVSG